MINVHKNKFASTIQRKVHKLTLTATLALPGWVWTVSISQSNSELELFQGHSPSGTKTRSNTLEQRNYSGPIRKLIRNILQPAIKRTKALRRCLSASTVSLLCSRGEQRTHHVNHLLFAISYSSTICLLLSWSLSSPHWEAANKTSTIQIQFPPQECSSQLLTPPW